MAEFECLLHVAQNQVEAGTFAGHPHTPLSSMGLVFVAAAVVVGLLVEAESRGPVEFAPEMEGHKIQVSTKKIEA